MGALGEPPPQPGSDGDEPFPAGLRDTFLQLARPMRARKGQIIVSEGADNSDVYLVCTGRVRITMHSPGGREVILRDLGSDCLFGELAAIDRLPRSASVVALELTQLAHMRGEDFLTFLGEVPQAGLWMARQMAARVRDLTDRTFALATLPVASRVQAELLRLAMTPGATFGSDDTVSIRPMPTHADMAARVGTHREAVSRELGLLAQEGLVQQNGRTLTILSHARLKQLNSRLRK